MHRRTKRIIGAIAVIALFAAGGAAFTFQNQLPSTDTAGYNNVQVSGADVTDIQNTLSTDGQYITSVALTFASAVPAADTVEVGFGPTAGTAPTDLTQWTCVLVNSGNGATCTPPTATTQTTSGANDFAVAVFH